MQEGNYEDAYKDVVNKSMELVKEIGKLKNFEFPKDKKGEELYYSIERYFEQNFGQFRSMFSLMENLANWYVEDEYIANTKEKKIEYSINPYNVLVEEFEIYTNTKKEIMNGGRAKAIAAAVKPYLMEQYYKGREYWVLDEDGSMMYVSGE